MVKLSNNFADDVRTGIEHSVISQRSMRLRGMEKMMQIFATNEKNIPLNVQSKWGDQLSKMVPFFNVHFLHVNVV